MSVTLFAALTGAVQMVAPDRWMPASVFVWQSGWKSARIAAFSLLSSTLHVILGLGIYALLAKFWAQVPEVSLAIFSLIFLGAVGAVRAFRFSRLREVFYKTRGSRRTIYTILSVVGPSEMLIPILMKARFEDVNMSSCLIAFWIGTSAAGCLALFFARASWNRPFALPSAVQWCHSKMAAIPMATGAFVGVLLLAIRAIV